MADYLSHQDLAALRSDQRTITVTTSLVQLLGPSPRRRAIIIQAPQTAHLDLFFRNQGLGTQGLRLHPGTSPLMLFFDLVGASVQEAIYGQTDTGTETIGVVDILEG